MQQTLDGPDEKTTIRRATSLGNIKTPSRVSPALTPIAIAGEGRQGIEQTRALPGRLWGVELGAKPAVKTEGAHPVTSRRGFAVPAEASLHFGEKWMVAPLHQANAVYF